MNTNTVPVSMPGAMQVQNARNASRIFMAANAISALVYAALALFVGGWQLWGLVAISLFLTLAGWAGISLSNRQRPAFAMNVVIIATIIGGLAGSALVADVGVLLASVVVLVSLVLAAQALPRQTLNSVLSVSGLGALFIMAINTFTESIQAKIPALQSTVPWLAAFAILAFGWIVVREFARYPISTKLLVIFLVVVLAAVSSVTITANWLLRNATDIQAADRTITLISLIVILGAGFISSLAAHYLTSPIRNLTGTSGEIAAGNLSARASIETDDEIGDLARTFNGMTAQLQETLGGLETRVAERTHDLELAAEVGRAVSQVRALDVMLTDAAELIRKQFDLYYTQIYLINPGKTHLILQSGTGLVGRELLGRSHRLPLDTASINGRAAIEKNAVAVANTLSSSTFRPNPLLPETRSEISAPLLIGETVIGVLDLQSDKPGVLSRDLLPAVETLAGQLAIAIQNARLLEETERARAEVEAQARRLTRANWSEYLDAIHMPEKTGFVFEGGKVAPQTGEEPVSENALVAPITVVGESLGNLVVEAEGQPLPARARDLLDTIARQVSQQIESLRLLETAERYRIEAEEASRRLTREGWKDYLQNTGQASIRYYYDTQKVTPEPPKQLENAKVVPIEVRGEKLGSLAVPGAESLSDQDRELIESTARSLSEHLESLRLTEQTRERAMREQALRQITSAVRASANPETILRTAARELGELLGKRVTIQTNLAAKQASES